MSEDDSDESTDQETAIVLDVLPHGRTEDDRPQYEKNRSRSCSTTRSSRSTS
jgi:hypothetical protein